MSDKSWNNWEKSPEANNPKIPLEPLELSVLDHINGGWVWGVGNSKNLSLVSLRGGGMEDSDLLKAQKLITEALVKQVLTEFRRL